jgi:metal transporter CNNM
MSGLTVGYLSIDMLILEIKLDSGTEQEKIYANKIKKVISDHHWILVTLLLCNAFACEAMPILLDKLVNDVMAIVISVTVLLFVGEIVPQALCTGPNQMKIAAFLAPFTYAFMIITYPLSYPIAKFMDCVVGLHGKTRFCNSDLKSVIELHVKEYKGNLNTQQMGYFTGFLDIMNKKVGELMIPIEKSFKLSNKYKIDKINIERLINSGFSRIPIYEDNQNNLIGILRLKDLVGIDLLHPSLLNELDINLYEAVHVTENTYFLDLFEKFKEGKSRMAFVHKDSKDSKDSNDEQLLPDKEKEEDQKEEDQKEDQIEAKEPLLINNIIEDEDNQIIDTNTKKEKKKNKNTNNFKNSPIIGIITLEDLIESWLKIHILDEENYDVDEKFRPRRKTTF